MPFAIVDIETTGGYASANGITEVAILIHDGKRVIGQYETLINPGCKIPYFITGLTGINDKMVANAPKFEEVAEQIYDMLKDHVFIAHNVNFDYSFLKHALANCGYDLKTKKLCTIRLSRKIIPNLKSYSLGNLCGYLGINIKGRHRAGGDAAATVKVFEHLLKHGAEHIIGDSIKRASKEQVLPPNVPKEQYERLPQTPGVYYFHDRKGKVVYVGKAVNIKKRVSGHFSNNSAARQRQNFLREVFHITFRECETGEKAFAFETAEIKRLWPKFNQAQKRFEPIFGIVHYYDQNGFKRLGIHKVKSRLKAVASFGNYIDGFNTLKYMVAESSLCPRLSGITKAKVLCKETGCICCTENNGVNEYNEKVELVIETLGSMYPPVVALDISRPTAQQVLNFA